MDRDELEGPDDDEKTPLLDHSTHNFKEGINVDEVEASSKTSQDNEIPTIEESVEPLINEEEDSTYDRLYDVLRHNILYAFFFKNNGIYIFL